MHKRKKYDSLKTLHTIFPDLPLKTIHRYKKVKEYLKQAEEKRAERKAARDIVDVLTMPMDERHEIERRHAAFFAKYTPEQMAKKYPRLKWYYRYYLYRCDGRGSDCNGCYSTCKFWTCDKIYLHKYRGLTND